MFFFFKHKILRLTYNKNMITSLIYLFQSKLRNCFNFLKNYNFTINN